MNPRDNGYAPAYPIVEPDRPRYASGLTKREWFAGMALQGILRDELNDWRVVLTS